MGDDIYETLPTSSVGAQMSAGALAGIMEHSVMFPIDSVKTRMQSLSPSTTLTSSSSLYSTLTDMIRTEGPLRTIRGMDIMVLGAGPAHAMYFCCYEQIKEFLRHRVTSGSLQPFIHGSAGCFATLLHDAIMTPADAVKQRMQMLNSPFSSSWDCIRKMYISEGSRAFYRSYTTQLSMNIPFQSLHFIVYEFMQGLSNAEGHYNPKAHMLSGAIAGATAAALTTPLDVCKTLLNTQETGTLKSVGKPEVVGLFGAMKTVFGVRGLRGFFRGLSARMLYQVPSTALSWSVYEFFKFFIQEEMDHHHQEHSMNSHSSKTSSGGGGGGQKERPPSDHIFAHEGLLYLFSR